MAGCHLHERRYSGAVRLPVIWQLQARGRIASAISEQRLAVADGDTRAPARRPGRRVGAEHRLDGGGDELRGLEVNGDVPAEEHRRTTWPACRGASCGLASMSALLAEVVVDVSAVHADGLGDLGDGVLPLAVRAGLPGTCGGRWRPAGRSAWACGRWCGHGPGPQPDPPGCPRRSAPLELIDRTEDVEGQPAGRRGRVDLLLQHDQVHAALMQLISQRQQVLE